ncbi:twin-arginine translocation signal domain-containing protein, partial [Neisseria dentiae]
MSKPYLIKSRHADDISNTSSNAAFSQVLQAKLSRRSLLQGSAAAGAAAVLP